MPRERDKERMKEEGSEKERRRGWFGRKVGSWDERKGGWMMAVVLRSLPRPCRRATTLIYDSLAHSGPHNSRLIPLLRSVRRYYLIRAFEPATQSENTRETKKTLRRRERLSRFRGGVSRDVSGKLDRLFRMRYSCVNFK